MTDDAIIDGIKAGVVHTVGILNGLIGRLQEKREDLAGGIVPAPSSYFDRLNLHPRILEASRDLFLDGHPWEAVFAAAKTLLNYVKDRSGRHELDGVPLMQTVFSANNPILAFNNLVDQTDRDEHIGMMHLFEGAVQAIRNPGRHSFPEGTEQRAVEYISFLSLLAYRVQEAKLEGAPVRDLLGSLAARLGQPVPSGAVFFGTGWIQADSCMANDVSCGLALLLGRNIHYSAKSSSERVWSSRTERFSGDLGHGRRLAEHGR